MKTDFLVNSRNSYWVAVIFLLICLAAILSAGCRSQKTQETPPLETELSLSSTAFGDGGAIPDEYTCEGEDIPPPLSWGATPAGTQSLALVVEDLDTSGMFTHWVVFDIPPDAGSLTEALSLRSVFHGGEGKNDFGNIGYGGPCPPSGKPHRYRFALYALDCSLDLEAGASKKQVIDAMEGHVIAQGQIIGTYQR
jgi:Raf kinase inhibitor-like YbhB/YbcL family protein